MPERVRTLAQRGLLIVGSSALLALAATTATPAAATTAVPAGSCLRLNHTAQALTEFNNLGPQVAAADAKASFALLQASPDAVPVTSSGAALVVGKLLEGTKSAALRAVRSCPGCGMTMAGIREAGLRGFAMEFLTSLRAQDSGS